jgi:hypothetical protein
MTMNDDPPREVSAHRARTRAKNDLARRGQDAAGSGNGGAPQWSARRRTAFIRTSYGKSLVTRRDRFALRHQKDCQCERSHLSTPGAQQAKA